MWRLCPSGCKGPILFYTGNEGPIDAFWGSNGFMQQVLSPKLGALLVFAEERYYGESQPEGGGGFRYLSTEQVRWARHPRTGVTLALVTNALLTAAHAEQVLADYAGLLGSLKVNLSAVNCPVVSFGGSYGATLTTLFRLKYVALLAQRPTTSQLTPCAS